MFGNEKEPQSSHPVWRQCIHCGRAFDLNLSDGWRISMEQFTCNWCYRSGQRDDQKTYDDIDS